MEILLVIGLASFMLGLLPLERLLENALGRHLGTGAGEALKGIGAVLLGTFLMGSRGAMALAGLAALGGRISPLIDADDDTNYPRGLITAGVVLVMVAPLSLFLLGFLLLASRAGHRFRVNIAMWTPAVLPVFLFKLYEADIYFVFGLFWSGLAIYQYLRYVERTSLNLHVQGPQSERIHARAFRLRSLLRRLALLSLIVGLLMCFYLTRYVYRGFGSYMEIFRRGPTSLPLVALTFDDGPNPKYTPGILNILADKEVKATFFMLGRNAELYPDLAKRVSEEGHEIGNHTYRHQKLLRTGIEASKMDLARAEEVITAATGLPVTLMRPPQGLYGPGCLEASRDLRYTVVLWSLSSRDWAEIGPNEMKRHLVNHTRNGEVILFHDGGDLLRYNGGDRSNTVRALPGIIDGLRERGFNFVTVTEMMIALGLAGEE